MKAIRILTKVVLWILGIFLLLDIALILAIRVPAVQNYVAQRAVGWVSDKTNSKITLDYIYIEFPLAIALEGLYAETPQGDTLGYVGKLSVGVQPFALMDRRLSIYNVDLENTRAFISRSVDSTFNFNYIIEAFASDEPKDTASSDFDVYISGIHLKNVAIRYDDALIGFYQSASVGALDVDVDEFSIVESTIRLNSIDLSNATSETRLSQTETANSTEENPSTSESAPSWIIFPGDLGLDNVKARLTIVDQLELFAQIGLLQVIPEVFDLDSQMIHVQSIELESSQVVMTQFDILDSTAAESTSDSSTVERPKVGWDLALGELNVAKSGIEIHKNGAQKAEQGFDPNHLKLALEEVKASDLLLNDNALGAEVEALNVDFDNDWFLRDVAFQALWNDEQVRVEDLTFRTPFSEGSLSATVDGKEILGFLNEFEPSKLALKADLSSLSIRDAHYFVPALDTNQWYDLLADSPLVLKTDVKGNLQELAIQEFSLSTEGLDASFNGNAFHLTDPEKVSGKFQIETLELRTQRLPQQVKDSLLPQGITLPSVIALRGTASGSLKKLKANIQGSLDQQQFSIDGSLAYSDSVNTNYDLSASFTDLPLGRYLQNDSLGDVSVQLQLKGQGWASSARNANAKLSLIGFDFVEYEYDSIIVNASLENEALEIQTDYRDSNLIFDLVAGLELGVKNPTYHLDLDLEGVDFQALKLVAYDARYTGHLQTEFSMDENNNIIGDLFITKLGVVRKGREAYIDSLLLVSARDTGGYRLQAESDILLLNYTGNVPVVELPKLANALVDRHYDLGDSASDYRLADKKFDLNVDVLRSDILNNLLIPGLTEYESVELSASFDGATERFEVDFNIPKLQYEKLSLDSFVLTARSDVSGFQSAMFIKTIAFDTLPIHALNLRADLADNMLNARLTTGDTANPDYGFSVQGKSTETGFSVRVPDRSVRLNSEDWDISPANAIVSDAGNWKTEEFTLSRGKMSFEVLAETSNSGVSMLMLDLKDFTLSSITGLIETDTSLVEGRVTGKFRLDSLDVDATINELAFMGYKAGTMRAQLHRNYEQQNMDIGLNWTDQGHEVRVEGSINPEAEKDQLDLTVRFSPFNLALVQGLMVGQISDLKGEIEGDVSIVGPMKAPEFNGRLNVRKTRLTVDAISTTYKIDNETILAQNGKLEFRNFAISDSVGNTVKLNGVATNNNYEDFDLSLTVKADNFRLLNAPPESKKPVRGLLVVDLDATATGKLSQPMVKGTLKVESDTDLEIEVPRPDLKAESYEGIVEFYDQDIEDHVILGREKTGSDSTRFDFLGVNATMDVQVDKQAKLSIIVDPVSGDYLMVQGGGQLALNIDPFGNLTLTGTYQIQKGAYKLSFYNLVKKEFSISPGSSIQWTGDPLQAQLRITAVYRSRVNPDNLFVGSPSASGSGGTVPVDVKLNLTGPLMGPEVDFDIVVPEDQKGAYGGRLAARLAEMNQNESELNKQVFGILVFNSFLPEESGGEGADNSSLARASASKILSSQLNKLGERYLNGVELSVNVDSYESNETSGSTDLELALKKGFFDDRLQVQVGSDVALEGERTTQQNTASDYLGDVEVTYKLTEDGRYKLRAFRKNEFDDLLEGELIKTGVGVNYTRNYDQLKELFRKPEETDLNE